MAKKKRSKFRFPESIQDQIREVDYWNKLNDEEKDFLNKFHDGELNNNHRKYEMFTEHPEYQTRIKKEIYDKTNSRNRDTYGKMKVTSRLDSLDHLSGSKEEAYISKLLFKTLSKSEKESLLINFGLKTFEDSMNSLLQDTIDNIRNKPKEIDGTYTLLRFYITANALIKEELKERRKK